MSESALRSPGLPWSSLFSHLPERLRESPHEAEAGPTGWSEANVKAAEGFFAHHLDRPGVGLSTDSIVPASDQVGDSVLGPRTVGAAPWPASTATAPGTAPSPCPPGWSSEARREQPAPEP